jgi:hypothetical protein
MTEAYCWVCGAPKDEPHGRSCGAHNEENDMTYSIWTDEDLTAAQRELLLNIGATAANLRRKLLEVEQEAAAAQARMARGQNAAWTMDGEVFGQTARDANRMSVELNVLVQQGIMFCDSEKVQAAYANGDR